MRRCLALLLALAMASPVVAVAADREAATAALFDRVKDDPARLRVFLHAMPKGGDLHNHVDGSPYAEDYLAWSAQRGLCIDAKALALADPPCAAPDRVPAAGLSGADPALYQRMIDALSVRGWTVGVGRDTASGHDRMFGAFGKFLAIAAVASAQSVAEVRRIAALDHVSYLELTHNPVNINRFAIATRDAAWKDDDLAGAFARLQGALPGLLAEAHADTDRLDAQIRTALACDTAHPEPGCAVDFRYVGYGLRLLPPQQLFSQLVALFALADADPRFVAVNLVQPEDDPAALANYALAMRMVAFLAARYPHVHRTWHAGELTIGMVPPEALADHIAQAVTTGRAERIGHGTDIAFETDAAATLARMARDRVDVEINLTSNDVILGVKGGDHPLRLYLAAGVPVTLSTDDEGVLRTDMTEQYVRAAREHGLGYRDLKRIARDSLVYAFLPPGPKAELQRRLDEAFAAFEASIGRARF